MYNSKKNFKMNDKNKAPFKVEDVNWDELSGIGILKDELEQAGELETLLRGEKTGVVSLSLVLLGVDVVMDASLQLVRMNDSPLLEIIGIIPTQYHDSITNLTAVSRTVIGTGDGFFNSRIIKIAIIAE